VTNKIHLSTLFFLVLFLSAHIESAESAKPNCSPEPNAVWHECIGKRVDDDGTTYEGSWQANKFHGYGKLISTDGIIVEGEFRDGQIHGSASLRSPNGSSYNGDWVAGEMNGNGVITNQEGTSIRGLFVDGELNGDVILTMTNGTRYIGGYANNKFEGPGLLIDSKGNEYKGIFQNGYLARQDESLRIPLAEKYLTTRGIEPAEGASTIRAAPSIAPAVDVTPDGNTLKTPLYTGRRGTAATAPVSANKNPTSSGSANVVSVSYTTNTDNRSVVIELTAPRKCDVLIRFGDGVVNEVRIAKNRVISIGHNYDQSGRYELDVSSDHKQCKTSFRASVSLGDCFAPKIDELTSGRCLGYQVYSSRTGIDGGMVIAGHEDLYNAHSTEQLGPLFDIASLLSKTKVHEIVDAIVKAKDPQLLRRRIEDTVPFPILQSPDDFDNYIKGRVSENQRPSFIVLQGSLAPSVEKFLSGAVATDSDRVPERYEYKPLFVIPYAEIAEKLNQIKMVSSGLVDTGSIDNKKLVILEEPASLKSVDRDEKQVFTYCSSLSTQRGTHAAKGVLGGRSRIGYDSESVNPNIHSAAFRARVNEIAPDQVRVRFVPDSVIAMETSRQRMSSEVGQGNEGTLGSLNESVCNAYVESVPVAKAILQRIAASKLAMLQVENVRFVEEQELLDLYAKSVGCETKSHDVNCSKSIYRDYAHFEFIRDGVNANGAYNVDRFNRYGIYDSATLDAALTEMTASGFSENRSVRTLSEYLGYKDYAAVNGYSNAVIAKQEEAKSKKREQQRVSALADFESRRVKQIGLDAKRLYEAAAQASDAQVCQSAAVMYKSISDSDIMMKDVLESLFYHIQKIHSAFIATLSGDAKKRYWEIHSQLWRNHQQEAGYGSQEFYQRTLTGRCRSVLVRQCNFAQQRARDPAFAGQVDTVLNSCNNFHSVTGK
jgi:hypothetical protein